MKTMCMLTMFFNHLTGEVRKPDPMDDWIIKGNLCQHYYQPDKYPCIESILLLPDGNRLIKCGPRVRTQEV